MSIQPPLINNLENNKESKIKDKINLNIDLNFDINHIWHPYTSTINPLPCYPVASTNGVYITLEDGTKLIDGMSSWWAAIHGYNNKIIKTALNQQLETMPHIMFGGITHKPAIDLCKTLVELTPGGLDTVFLSDSGSVAVEVALKMALQYWHSKNENRAKFLTVRNGYHGDTFAAMSVTDPDNSMHSIYKGFLPEHIFSHCPQTGFHETWDQNPSNHSDILDLEQKLAQHHQNIAAVILEPIVQGAGGMRIYHPNYLKRVRELCNEYNILLILDEIATGFGRTGKLFACEHAGITPDILCLGKALTGGTISLAATITTKQIANIICSGSSGCFMHGPTFMGNPLACSAANASLSIIQNNNWINQTKFIEDQLKNELMPLLNCKTQKIIKDVRVLGAIGVVEMQNNIDVGAIQKKFIEQDVWIRPFGKLIYIMPPFIINSEQLSKLTRAISTVINNN